MHVYFIFIAIIYLISKYITLRNNRWGISDILLISMLVIFSGTRKDVGTDYGTYYNIYNVTIGMNFDWTSFVNTSQEFGYYILSLLTKKIIKLSYGIFISASILTYIPIYKRIKAESKNFSLSIILMFLLGVYTNPFNVIRQWIAIAINFYAHRYILANKKRFIFLNIIASLFHITAPVVTLIQLILLKLKPTYKLVAVTIVSSVSFIIFYPYIMKVFIIIGNLDSRYLAYLDANNSGIGLKLMIILKLFMVIYTMIYCRRDKLDNYYVSSLIVSLFFMIIGTINIPLSRVANYFDIHLLILLPKILSQIKPKERVVHIYFLMLMFISFFTLSLIFYGDLIPYSSYLF